MATPPLSTKNSLIQRLTDRARERWPDLTKVEVRFRGQFAYIDGHLPDGEIMRLCRLRYRGSATNWGSLSTGPATTTTNPATCPAGSSPEPPKKPSTAPAAST